MQVIRCYPMLLSVNSYGIHFSTFSISPILCKSLTTVEWLTSSFSANYNVDWVRSSFKRSCKLSFPNSWGLPLWVVLQVKLTPFKSFMIHTTSNHIISIGFINHLLGICCCLVQLGKNQHAISNVYLADHYFSSFFPLFLNTG